MIFTSTTILALVLSLVPFQDVVSFDMTIEPTLLRIRDKQNVTIMCRANVSFSDCQFTWWDVDDLAEGLHFFFENGSSSESAFLTEGTKLSHRLAGYEYAGSGLDRGECGIRLIGVTLRYRVVSCRARSKRGSGSWHYASMSLCSHSAPEIGLDFEPQQLIVTPGSPISILSRTTNPKGTPLLSCSFTVQRMKFALNNNSPTSNSSSCRETKSSNCHRLRPNRVVNPTNYDFPPNSRTSSIGSGLQNGQCGVTIQNISESENGWLHFEAQAAGGRYDRRVVHLTVAKPPIGASLEMSTQMFVENETITATCTVQESRPAASIKWVIGNEVIREDSVDDSVSWNLGNSSWWWDHEPHSFSQTLVHPMKRAYDKQNLECVVTHFAMPQENRKKRMLSLINEATIDQSQIVTFYESVGSPVEATCPTLTPNDIILPVCRLDGRIVSCTVPAADGTMVSTVCKQGYSKVPGTDWRVMCSGGSWRGNYLQCRQTPMCPGLSPTSGVKLSCRKKYNNEVVNCSQPMPFGTKATMRFECPLGFIPKQATYNFIVCKESQEWDNQLLSCIKDPASQVLCPPLSPKNGLVLVCTSDGQLVDCLSRMSVGTVAVMEPQCNKGFTVIEDPEYRSISCLESGVWERPILECQEEPGCGRSRKLDDRPSGIIDKPASYGEFPWHVGIYKLTSRGYEQICGGSLISMDTVITAASCFWKDRITKVFNSSIYKVVAGKLRRSYNVTEEHTQTKEIKSASVPERYTGRDTDYQINIAKLTLSSPMRYTHYVNSVCVDWEKEREREQMTDEQKAFIPGWAFAEEDSPGEVLSSITMPFIPFERCNNELSPDLKRLFTGDKFCAGSTQPDQGFTICDSDHGAGLVFYSKSLGKYELRGIASVAFKPITNRDTCYASKFSAFTLFSMFSNWARGNRD